MALSSDVLTALDDLDTAYEDVIALLQGNDVHNEEAKAVLRKSKKLLYRHLNIMRTQDIA